MAVIVTMRPSMALWLGSDIQSSARELMLLRNPLKIPSRYMKQTRTSIT
jgi:hypothetical protein